MFPKYITNLRAVPSIYHGTEDKRPSTHLAPVGHSRDLDGFEDAI